MFERLAPGGLIIGAKYALTKERVDTLMNVRVTPPHTFTFKGVTGVGDHQDQYDFVDDEGNTLSFCPALPLKYGVWSDFLVKIEE